MITNPHPAQGLTIGDLARRTGLTPATLRAWETRHGFPRPERLQSGHRRYDERDVDLVQLVLRRKDAGVRLEVAIAEAAESRRTPTTSVYAELRRRHEHLAPHQLRKTSLLALTWAMEDECCARAQRPSLFGAFQHERNFRHAEDRWRELARTARSTVVFADFPEASTTDDGIVLVPLPGSAPMRREWSLVCDAPDHPAALAAWELPGQTGVRDRDRVFEAVWTLEPQAVRDAARACTAVAAAFAPQARLKVRHLDAVRAPQSDDLRAATSMFNRLIAYVDKLR